MKAIATTYSEAQLRVTYKLPKNPIKVFSKNEAEEFFYKIWDTDLLHVQEQFYVIYLNKANTVVCWRCLHTGTIANTTVDPRLLFGFAFAFGATAMIIAHNHPSGKLNPSQSDISLHKKIEEAAKLLEVNLLDHLIINGETSLSFKEQGFCI